MSPGRPRPLARELFAVRPHAGAHRVALRAGISVLVPLLVVVAIGRPEWSTYAAFGAFTSLNGRNRVHLSRLRMQATLGVLLTVSVALGVLVGSLDARSWWSVPIAAVLAGGGAILSNLQDWHPPGPLFLVFAIAVTASIPSRVSEIAVAVAVAELLADRASETLLGVLCAIALTVLVRLPVALTAAEHLPRR